MKKQERTIKAIIFDLDGTLIDSTPYHFIAFKEMLLEQGVKVSDRDIHEFFGMSTLDVLKSLKKKYGFKQHPNDLKEERRYHYFKHLNGKNILFPGTQKLVQQLRLKYKIGIATGSSRIIFYHSTEKDFQALFECIVTIDDVKKGKPDPAQLVLAAKKLGVQPSNCLMVGDSTYDQMAANRAGIISFGVGTGTHSKNELKKAGAEFVADKLSGIKKILKAWA